MAKVALMLVALVVVSVGGEAMAGPTIKLSRYNLSSPPKLSETEVTFTFFERTVVVFPPKVCCGSEEPL
ncbi:hypothetical protein [Pontibacter actiniarum]|uniref:hypothetical protein n=1 Tax=Pontibacter actiniarum TaxID=323450 RepID=UPI001B87BAFC|nr:hypothetical protein [Pontibacter actiniarum]